MRRAQALRTIAQLVTASVLAGCDTLACTQYPVPASAGSAMTPTRFGSQMYASDDLERALGLLAGCGGSLIRIELNENLDFADAVCAAATQRNMRVIMLSPRLPQPVDVDSYARTCAALQQRYVQYNPVWEIWNEPNLAQYWYADPNADDYSRLAIAAGKALRGVGARDVWTGGTSGAAILWHARLKANGVFNVMNGGAVHSYEPPCEAFSDYLNLQARVPGVQFHTTETCVPSIVTQNQSSFLTQMWHIHRLLGIPTMVWCELRDGTAGNSGVFTLPYGLIDANYTRKASYFTARSLIGPYVSSSYTSGGGATVDSSMKNASARSAAFARSRPHA